MARQRSSHARLVSLLGAAATAAVAAASALGLLDGLERQTADLRFEHARLTRVAASDRVRLVMIDDGAVATVGRWPWPRTRLAEAIDELRRAGAGVIALDILLDDAQPPSIEEQGGAAARLDHDAALERALHEARSVVAVNLAAFDSLGQAWRTARGAEELEALLRALGSNIQTPDADAADVAALTGPRRADFLARPGEFRSLAAARAAAAALERGEPFARFVAAVAPGVTERTGEYPQRVRVERAWDQQQAWRALRRTFRPSDDAALDMDDSAPLTRFAEAATGSGFVDVTFDADGVVRRLYALRPTQGGRAIQLGLAGAAALLRVAPGEVRAAGRSIGVGDSAIPLLANGDFVIDWPRTDDGYRGMFRRSADDPIGHGYISIGFPIALAAERAKADLNRARLETTTRLLQDRDPGAAVSAADIAAATERAREYLRQFDQMAAEGVTLEADEANVRETCLKHVELQAQAERGPQEIEAGEKTLRDAVSGRLVFIGYDATGAIADFVRTPLGPRTPGVVAHAVAADMALSGRAIAPAPGWAAPALALAVGLACTALAGGLGPASAAGAAIAVLAGYLAVAGVWLFNVNLFAGSDEAARRSGLLMPMAAPLLAGVAAYIACTAAEATLAQRDRRRIERQFKARVSGQLVDFLVSNPGSLSMEGETREITSLFVDLAGFTSISERLDGKTTVALLNRCMRAMTAELTAENAYVNKFLGDGLMAFWSAFGQDPDQARRACRAALACQRAVAAVNDDPAMQGLPRISARIGIATGPVTVGDCGAPPELNDYTVIGNAVNLAARLESANKQFGTAVLIDGVTMAAFGADAGGGAGAAFRLRPVGRIVVVGQSTPVETFEIVAPDADGEWIEATEQAVAAYQRGDFAASREMWGRLAARWGKSKLADAYREAMDDLGSPPTDWDGALRLRAK